MRLATTNGLANGISNGINGSTEPSLDLTVLGLNSGTSMVSSDTLMAFSWVVL